jgi:hypothetical protein
VEESKKKVNSATLRPQAEGAMGKAEDYETYRGRDRGFQAAGR